MWCLLIARGFCRTCFLMLLPFLKWEERERELTFIKHPPRFRHALSGFLELERKLHESLLSLFMSCSPMTLSTYPQCLAYPGGAVDLCGTNEWGRDYHTCFTGGSFETEFLGDLPIGTHHSSKCLLFTPQIFFLKKTDLFYTWEI